MYKCQGCTFATNWLTNLRRHEKGKHKEDKLKETYIKNTVYSNNSRSQEKVMHNEGELKEKYIENTVYSMDQDVYDIRLQENFKVFISGPSRCGKTVFVFNLCLLYTSPSPRD